MPGFHIRPAYNRGSGTALIEHKKVVSDQTFKQGAPLALVSGEIQEHAGGNVVTGIVGFAMADDTTAPGYDLANNSKVIHVTGRENTVPVAIAAPSAVFMGKLTNGVTTTYTTPTASHLRTYGMVKQADGTWTVDVSDITDVVVRVIKILDVTQKLVLFTVLSSASAN